MIRFLSGQPVHYNQLAGQPHKGLGLSRRAWLRIGSLAGLGCLWENKAARGKSAIVAPGFGRAKSVILVYASGGQSQFETWDPKPNAPDGIRGEFKAISTAVPGTIVCEHLPRLASLADRYAIVRSLSHADLDHGSATHLALTGHYHPRRSSNPPASPNDAPTYGAVLKRVRQNSRLPFDAVHINGPVLVPENPSPGQDGGILGRQYEPLLLGDVSTAPVAIPCLDVQLDLPLERLKDRQALRETLDGLRPAGERDRQLLDMNHLYRQAFEMLSSPRTRQAFDLTQEPARLRDRYGRHRSGQACLLARRLVEAGVPLINVIWNHNIRGQDRELSEIDDYGWDTHNDIFELLRNHLLPRFDVSFSALLEDLDRRRLLDETLVVCMGEFGRAPRIALEPGFLGKTPGRKHWSSVYSILVAGAGVKRGAVVGASDPIGAHPIADRIGPWDIAATMFSALGIDPAQHYLDALNRPFPICTGQPVRQLYEG